MTWMSAAGDDFSGTGLDGDLTYLDRWDFHVENPRKIMGKPWENGGLMGFYGMYPLVMTKIAMENHH